MKFRSNELAVRAIRFGEIEEFLRGKFPYDWKSLPSSSGRPNDIAQAWSGLRWAIVERGFMPNAKDEMKPVFKSLLEDIEGIEISSVILMCECLARNHRRPAVPISLEDLTAQLGEAILLNWHGLKAHRVGSFGFPDETLERLRQLSSYLSSHGHSFFPQKYNW
jgi:hypothetical protein